ncbi:MAG: tetratricopeptide repeat protein [Candidatus Omnitrophica bacterium]|nr:tetratricopeptide repeat protein [Candidatus Omnitrophota bacterium]MDD5355938.1 tetratricopeptide repeat protein [Candidatus Omnitrophota bacterium]
MKYKVKKFLFIIVTLLLAFGVNADYCFARGGMEEHAAEYFQEGLEAHRTGDIEAAITLYTKAIYAKPDYAQAHNNLGTAYAQKHDYAKAEQEYRYAIELDSQYSLALRNLALIYAERQDYEKFYEYWKRATGLNVQSPFLIDEESGWEDED